MSGPTMQGTPEPLAGAGHASPLAAQVDSSWHSLAWERFTSRVPVVPGRFVGSAAGLLGVVLAAPLVFLPTHSIVLEAGPGETARLSFWSWGRIADETPHVAEPLAFDNHVQLVFFLVSLVIGVAACLLYAFRRGTDGRVLGAAGVAWLGAQVVGDLTRGVGDSMSGLWSQGATGVDVLAGGMFQIASAVALCTAVLAICVRPLLGLGRSAWVWSAGATRRARERAQERARERDRQDEHPAGAPPPRVGIATIRDAPAPYEQPAWHSGEAVGFTDDPDRDRFGPPG